MRTLRVESMIYFIYFIYTNFVNSQCSDEGGEAASDEQRDEKEAVWDDGIPQPGTRCSVQTVPPVTQCWESQLN